MSLSLSLSSSLSGGGAVYLSSLTAPDSLASGDLVGTLSFAAPGPVTYTLLDDAGGQFAISGSTLVAGATALNHTTNPTASITVQADNGAGRVGVATFTMLIKSYARYNLDLLGGVGIFASYQHNSVSIVDTTTPANNYDGTFAGIFEQVGTWATGPNGGLRIQSGTHARILATKFPWSTDKFSTGIDMVPLSTGNRSFVGIASPFHSILTGIYNFALVWNSGATTQSHSNIRGNGAGVRHRYAGSASATGTSLGSDESGLSQATGKTVPTLGTGNYFELGIGGTGEYAEILEAFFLPGELSAAQINAYTKVRDPKSVYIDTVAGNDSNDGLTTSTPKATWPSFATQTAFPALRQGDNIKIKYGSRFRGVPSTPSGLSWTSPLYIPVSPYGTAADGKPIIDGSLTVDNSGWTSNATFPGVVWDRTITQSWNSSLFYPMLWYGDDSLRINPRLCLDFSTTSQTVSTGSKVFTVSAGMGFAVGQLVRIYRVNTSTNVLDRTNRLYGIVTDYTTNQLTVNVVHTTGSGTFASWAISITNALIGYWSGANIAANLAFVAANPGTFTAFETGSATPNPANSSPGTQVTYYINPPDGADPTLNAKPISYAQQATNLFFNGSADFTEISIQRCGTKDLASLGGVLNKASRMTDCDFLDAATHGIVFSPIDHLRTYARGLPTSIPNTGGGIHFFWDDVQAGGPSLPCTAVDCVAEGFLEAFYSHGTGTIANSSVHLTSCKSVISTDACNTGGNSGGVGIWTIENHQRIVTGPYVTHGADVLINSP